ncbi:MAG: serine hydrolase [Phenylobacterium sp.]|jgi:CubicO group peptidase (beta-lactamase class C family)|uniref:serine hydrolase domain-containing protein n=1 Tax=Phenylobacterium sp. TaxID=1871053 RepID=UPI002A35ECC0|nr:serine hydrolase [Phenylobacterium sp.]MDX9999473.1 serine hydrolase [Phenylobacterium sp.]
MRKLLPALLFSGLLLAAPTAQAQTALKPGTPSILFWSAEQQEAWYPAIEKVYKVSTVRRGGPVRPLPKADREIDPTFSYAGKTYSVSEYMRDYRVAGLLVLKDGKIVLERYGLGRRPRDRWTSFSVAKSVTSTLVGAAIQDGYIKSLEDPVTDYIPELRGSGYDGVNVRQLLMMSSGVKWNEDYTDPNSDVAQAGAAILEPGVNPIVSYMRKLPRANPPGTRFTYNTGETDLVGVLVSKATGKSLARYASEKLWKPLGMERDAIWMLDLAGHERGGCCMSITLRDYGRIGQFMLEGGVGRGGKRILPEWWTAQATSPQIKEDAPPPGYGYFWWMLPDGYAARGIFGQSIVTIPEEKLVIVVNSAWPQATGRELSAAQAAMVAAVRQAAKDL